MRRKAADIVIRVIRRQLIQHQKWVSSGQVKHGDTADLYTVTIGTWVAGNYMLKGTLAHKVLLPEKEKPTVAVGMRKKEPIFSRSSFEFLCRSYTADWASTCSARP